MALAPPPPTFSPSFFSKVGRWAERQEECGGRRQGVQRYGRSYYGRTGVGPSGRNKLPGNASRLRAAFSRNEPTGRLVELIKTRVTLTSDFSEASPARFYSRSPAAHHWSPRRCGVPPNLTESSSQSRVQTTPSVNKWSAASRRSALVRRARRQTCSWTRPPCRRRAP